MTDGDPGGEPSPARSRRRSPRHEPRPPFEDVVAEHGPTVMRVCTAMLDRTDADDAWIDTFVSAMRAYPQLPAGSNVRGWLVTIAHNRAIDQVRASRRRPTPMEQLPEGRLAPRDPAEAADDHRDLRAALDTLGAKQRAAVVYRHLGDLPYAEIAQLMGISQSAVRRNVSDGITKLRTLLEGAQP
jgi:RNA polymerase sigma factor (sigma-70 family)